MLPTSRLIAPTAPGSRESLDGTSTGSKGEKQTADEDEDVVNAEKLLELSVGCLCESPVPKVMTEFLFASSVGGAFPKLLMETEDEITSGPLAIAVVELQGILIAKLVYKFTNL